MGQKTKNYFFAGLTFTFGFFLLFSHTVGDKGAVGGISIEVRPALPQAAQKKWKTPKISGQEAIPRVSARTILIKDPDSQVVLYETNPEEKLPIASLTKLMTALVVLERVSPEEMAVMQAEDLNVGPNKTDLAIGEKVLVRDLLKAMLVGSANDAALTLARHVGGAEQGFVRFMNRKARALGMKNTSFQNPAGFDDPAQFSTARDLAILVEDFLAQPDLVEIVGQKEISFYALGSQKKQHLTATNQLLRNPSVLGIKTGYTSEAKGNIIILASPHQQEGEGGPRYYLIILGSLNREQDAQTLMRWVEKNFAWN